ncbi:SAM-dependent methyltransferase [Chroococcidiopsis sp. CCNUC1]|nr:SAM-dependent methyltransferase [Chroococcidiopsis sp. CCNUC1]URD51384.1 SAM-dependent methyltransferase [Chroococcidiopsis sp. CCNUC1]
MVILQVDTPIQHDRKGLYNATINTITTTIPYINIGQQDITAHVDFTALQRWGDRCGLPTVGFTQQGLFLMALGLGDRIAALSQTTSQSLQQVLWRRDALHQLLDPMGLGGFGVLIQSRGLTETEVAQPLMGLK